MLRKPQPRKSKRNNPCQIIKQSTELGPEITQMLQLPNKEVKILMINQLNDIVGKVGKTCTHGKCLQRDGSFKKNQRITSTG